MSAGSPSQSTADRRNDGRRELHDAPRKRKIVVFLLLALITLVAFGLRVANLGRFSLWLDEAAEAD